MKKSGWTLAFFGILIVFCIDIAWATNVCGTYSTNQNWTLAGSPWVVTCSVTISGTANLTIEAGAQVRFANATSLTISSGKLTAIGTSGSTIVFTSDAANPGPGSWKDIILNGSNPTSRISYATISYGGATNGRALYINATSITVDHVTVSYSSSAGIRVLNASPTLDTVTVTNCTGDGLISYGASANPVITNSSFSNNGGEGIDIQSNGGINLTNSTISGNTSYAITTVASSCSLQRSQCLTPSVKKMTSKTFFRVV